LFYKKRLGVQIYLMMIMACFEHECSSHHELRNSETIFKIKEKSVSKRKKGSFGTKWKPAAQRAGCTCPGRLQLGADPAS